MVDHKNMSVRVRSRDGKELREFDLSRITNAMKKAFDAAEIPVTPDVLNQIGIRAYANAKSEIHDGILDVESIQDAVEDALVECGFRVVKKLYNAKRRERASVRHIKDEMSRDVVYNYTGEIDDADPFVQNNNASQKFCFGGLMLSVAGNTFKTFWLSEVYDAVIRQFYDEGLIHIHDLDMLTGYCAGWSLADLIRLGIPSVGGKTAAAPAKHLPVLCNQIVNFLGILQNEWAGAQAISSFDTYLAPFVRADSLTYDEVKKAIQSFVFGVNMPSRWGGQAPFTNITLDWVVPKDLKDQKAIVGGKEQSYTYGECQKEADMINKAFLEVMIAGDKDGRGFAYPIPTYSITKDFDWADTENNRLLFEMTAKYGTPYFSNYINSDMEPSDVRSMCCRLRLDLRELRRMNGGNFGAGENTGSIGVVTVNLPRIAYLSDSKADFFKRLRSVMDVAARSLKMKKDKVQYYMNMGLYPYSKYYLQANGEGHELKNHFSTIGLVGMNEALENIHWAYYGDLTTEEGRAFALEVLDFMRNALSDYQEQYGDLYNLEATPAEATAYKFARKDAKDFSDIVTAAKEGQTPYYTNSTHLPVDSTRDIFDALDMEDAMQVKYTSGTVFHAFVGERLQNWEAAAKLVRTIATNYKLPYFTISPTYSICPDHGYISGEHFKCPKCGKDSEVYSRITGYYRPVQNWNAGKVQEFKNRLTYDTDFKFEGKPHGIAYEPEDNSSASTPVAPAAEAHEEKPILLVKESGCPKCAKAEGLVNELKLNDKVRVVTIKDSCEGEGYDLAVKYGVMSAPALIDGDSVVKDLDQVLETIKTLD